MDPATWIERELETVPPEKREALRHSLRACSLEVERDMAREKVAKLERDLTWTRKMNRMHGNALDELRFAVLDAIPLIEEAMNALDRHDIEVPGLNSALADLQTCSE